MQSACVKEECSWEQNQLAAVCGSCLLVESWIVVIAAHAAVEHSPPAGGSSEYLPACLLALRHQPLASTEPNFPSLLFMLLTFLCASP